MSDLPADPLVHIGQIYGAVHLQAYFEPEMRSDGSLVLVGMGQSTHIDREGRVQAIETCRTGCVLVVDGETGDASEGVD